ncbi:Uncharacterised protein [Vibrio cholerae]|nr:Uncharacterised protein [Vibrio cholerae]CSI56485.1 Uncharacterised protein [Vibrio cholerae]
MTSSKFYVRFISWKLRTQLSFNNIKRLYLLCSIAIQNKTLAVMLFSHC